VTIAAFATVCVLGAWARVGLTSLLDRPTFPTGTLVVNLTGSLVAGFLHARLDGGWELVAVTGALGAFTTFSTFATQLAEHLRSGRRWHAATYTVLTVVGAVAAATVGLVLGA